MIIKTLTLAIISAVLQPIRSYENLSRWSSTVLTQSSTYTRHVASLAKDGIIRTTEIYCAHTAPGFNKAWFQVDFGSQYNTYNVKIYFRKEGNGSTDWQQYRLRQFYLDISDLPARHTTTAQRTRCYTDNTTFPNLPPNIIDIPCKHTARYVIVETTYDAPEDHPATGAILEICEIEVYGCQSATWGLNCTENCGSGCLNSMCDVQNGYCIRGCIAGYWGDSCDSACPGNCKELLCDRQNGSCSGACTQGYWGDFCNQQCLPHCKESECDKITGRCTEGCDVGWYGDTCTNVCSPRCVAGSSEQRSGACSAGCVHYWSGDQCDICEATYYGPDCSGECSVNCIQKTCNNITGVCISCIDGMFGESCNLTCSSGCVSGCDRYTGNCVCKPAQQFSGLTTNTQPILYGIAVVLCLSLVLNIFSFTWIYVKGMCRRQNSSQYVVNEISVPPVIYDTVADNTGYEEFEVSGPSHYDEVQ